MLFEPRIENGYFISSDNTKLHLNSWKTQGQSESIIIAIHGFSDYANSFKGSGIFFKMKNIDFFSFDLRGFGRNNNFGYWNNYKKNIKDIIEFCEIIKEQNPKKKIFLMGESMGGSLATVILAHHEFQFDGLILVAPSIWDFSKNNYFKSKIISFLSTIIPNFKMSGKGIISIKPSDNIEMLRRFSKDPFVIHKPSLQSLNEIIKLMDKSYEDYEKIISSPRVPTLLVIPILDEIIPRKPLINLLKRINFEEKFKNKKLTLKVYQKNYHMILRDIDGLSVIKDIYYWLNNLDKINYNISNADSYELLLQLKKVHRLD